MSQSPKVGFNPAKPYSILMRGQPDEPESHRSIAVYSRDEEVEFLNRGWQKDKHFMNRVDRARRKDM